MIGQDLSYRSLEQRFIGNSEEYSGNVIVFGESGIEGVVGSALGTVEAQILGRLALDIDFHETRSLFECQYGNVHERNERHDTHQIHRT